MKNAFTIDLEDWFCSHNLVSAIKYEDWHLLESRVLPNTYSLMELLNRNKTKATFFVLGWIAERFPALISDIHKEGHEIASHGFAHRQVTHQDSYEFQADLERSIEILRSITGIRPKGYRAPAFSITEKTSWALPILMNKGFLYDSSIYPLHYHPDYGNDKVPLEIHTNNGLIEVPLSCTSIAGFRMPCSGGAYLRFYPYSLFTKLVRRVNKENRPLIFYIHPWEIDDNPPKLQVGLTKSIRHSYNISSTYKKIEKLLGEFEFTSIEEILEI